MKKLLFAFLTFLLPLSCYAGNIRPEVDDIKYLEYAEKFKSVVFIGIQTEDASGFGSGVVISEKWVLTAAHVVNNAKSAFVKVGNKSYKIEQIYIHKNYKEENVGLYDIALCKILGGIKLTSYPKLYAENNEVGKSCSVSGYGMTGNLKDGATKFDKKKRAGTNSVGEIFKHLLVCDASKENPTALEFLICSGDSGGGLFIQDKVAGINSIVMAEDQNPDSDYGDSSGHTRVSVFKDWIEEIVNKY